MVFGGFVMLEDCKLFNNDKYALVALDGATVGVSYCEVKCEDAGEVYCEVSSVLYSRGTIRDKSEAVEGTKPPTDFDRDYPWDDDLSADNTLETSTNSVQAPDAYVASGGNKQQPVSDVETSAKARGVKRKSKPKSSEEERDAKREKQEVLSAPVPQSDRPDRDVPVGQQCLLRP